MVIGAVALGNAVSGQITYLAKFNRKTALSWASDAPGAPPAMTTSAHSSEAIARERNISVTPPRRTSLPMFGLVCIAMWPEFEGIKILRISRLPFHKCCAEFLY